MLLGVPTRTNPVLPSTAHRTFDNGPQWRTSMTVSRRNLADEMYS
jgi:hypothetical protein